MEYWSMEYWSIGVLKVERVTSGRSLPQRGWRTQPRVSTS